MQASYLREIRVVRRTRQPAGAQGYATQTTPERPAQQSFRVRRECTDQPVRSFGFTSGFAGCVGKTQEAGRTTPALIGALQLRFVKLGDLIKLFELAVAFGDRLAYVVQAIRGHRQRQILAFVTGEQEPHIHVVIEIVVPAFLKTFSDDVGFPEMRWLRS